MAVGYAHSRPPLHAHIIERARASLGLSKRAERALDIGCGAGLSTKALANVAGECIGLDPSDTMLKCSAMVAPGAHFVAATAESIPLCDQSIDLMTAAGSLNYVDLALFFSEATRVLRPSGTLIVYDFSPGTSFRHTGLLDEWFSTFLQRYPTPVSEGRVLSPEILRQLASGFRVQSYEHLEIAITLAPQFYIDYMLTETNVAAAIRNKISLEEIRSWCTETLGPIWDGKEQEVLFRGYFVCMETAPARSR